MRTDPYSILTPIRSHDSNNREVATWRDEQASQGERFGYNVRNQLTSAVYNANQVWTGNPLSPSLTASYTVDALNFQSW